MMQIRKLVRNVQWEKITHFTISIICVCALWWGLLPHINALLQAFVAAWFEPLNYIHAGIVLYILIGIGIASYLLEHVMKMAHLRLSTWWGIILITIIYSYYRFDPLSPFELWNYRGWVLLDILYVVDVILLGCEISYHIRYHAREIKINENEADLLLDNAITRGQDDFFNYSILAHELMVRLSAVNLSQHAFSVGIVGDWGLGKSSLLNLFAEQVEAQKQLLVRFSPRSAKKLDLIQEEFFAAFTETLSHYSYNAHYKVGKYAYALNISSSTKWLYALINWFNGINAIANKKQVNDMIRATGKRVYVIIEDLDRLTGQEILEVLKLIDSNGNFCNTVFLSAYDKTYVNHVLNHVIGYGDVKQDFTDKFFQYEMSLFKHPNTQLYAYLSEKMYGWALTKQFDDVSRQQIQQEWTNVYRYIIPNIKTLRHAKRYINLFRMTYDARKLEVDFADCAIVTLIRYLDIQAYYDLYDRKYLTFDGMLQSDRSQYKLANDYQKKIEQSQIPNYTQLLSFLFETTGVRQFDSLYNRLCRTESFEKYFYRMVDGKIYSEELNVLMSASTEDEAIKIVQSFRQRFTNSLNSIREFLWSRQPSWVQTPNRLKRYMCLLLYAQGTIPDINLTGKISDLLHRQVADNYDRWMNRDVYLESVSSAFAIMQQYVPSYIGSYMHARLTERYGDSSLLDEYCVEPLSQDQLILNEAIRNYDSHYELPEWNPLESIRLTAQIENEEETYYEQRAAHLKEMMVAHPNEYAEAIINFYETQHNRPETHVSINYYNEIISILGGQRNFKKWIKSINNPDLSYIIWELNYYGESHFAHETGLGMVVEKPKDNYAKIAAIIKKSSARASIRASKRNRKKVE